MMALAGASELTQTNFAPTNIARTPMDRRPVGASGPGRHLRTIATGCEHPSGACIATVVTRASFVIGASHLEPATSTPEIDTSAELDRAARLISGSTRESEQAVDGLVISGHVHAPDDTPVFDLTARVGLGRFEHRIDVFGDRVWTSTHTLAALPFVRMPIERARSAGGPGTDNPSGVPSFGRRATDGLYALPHFVPHGHRPRELGESIPFVELGSPLRSLDPGLRDLALAELRACGCLELDHLHPRLPRLRITLPDLRLCARVQGRFVDQAIELELEGLLISADLGTLDVVYRGRLWVTRDEGSLKVDLSEPLESQRAPLPQATSLEPQPTLVLEIDVPPWVGEEPDEEPLPQDPPRRETIGERMARDSHLMLIPTRPGLASVDREPLDPIATAVHVIATAEEPPEPVRSAVLTARDYGGLLALVEAFPEASEVELALHGFDLPTFTARTRSFERVVKEQARKGSDLARREIDTGYVAELENRLGPLSPAEVARLLVDRDLDEGDPTLPPEWPRAGYPRVIRVFLDRAGADPKLRGELRRAEESERARRTAGEGGRSDDFERK